MDISNKTSFVRQRILERNLKDCMNISPKQMETIVQLLEEHEGIDNKQSPLLIIKLENETSTPKVIYQGEEVTNKTRVSFDWETTEELPLSGGTRYNIEHFVKCNKHMVKKGFGLSRGKYMFDNDEQL